MSKIHPLIMRKMELIVESNPEVAKITGPGEHPPCFESLEQYHKWLEAVDPELGSPPPLRKDWPKEPNYCRDCNAAGRNEMRKQGRCLFPSTVFIEVGEGDDIEVVGTS